MIEGVTVINQTSKKPREFLSGAIRDSDENKEDYIESISWLTMKRYAFYMKKQEVKYGRGNWKKGIPIEEYEKSLMRHLQKYLVNKYDDGEEELDIDHLAAALFNLQGLIHEEEKLKRTKNDN
jgi:dATP/dGTP diphosphohydrolase